jgi:quinol-cytochrome oxidoreductase complex cytochrome b subunit
MMDNSVTDRAEERNWMRAAANNVILHLHPTRVDARALRFAYTWGLGGISAVLVVMLVVTGTLLMFRYEPSVERAYISIKFLESQVMFGALFRAVHHWSANLLVITVILHLVRVFLTGGFKRGRTINWLVGLSLLLVVLAFNFTGYLLPWDQLAYWAVTVGTSLISYIPLIGKSLSQVLLGGPEVGQGALTNFYAIHVALLPILLAVVMAYHFWRIRKDGGISQPDPAPGARVERVTTIPHLVRVELAALAVVVVAIVIFSMLVPAPLAEMADPTNSPNPAKAAWYFLGFQEMLLHMHPLALMGLVAIVLLGLIYLPRWDRAEGGFGLYFRSPTGRRAAVIGALLSLQLVPLLIVADEYWVDLPSWLPGWPGLISNGLLPLLLTLAGLAAVYLLARAVLKANHSEGLVGLFTFIMVGLVVLTVTGVYFRGANMALVLPF